MNLSENADKKNFFLFVSLMLRRGFIFPEVKIANRRLKKQRESEGVFVEGCKHQAKCAASPDPPPESRVTKFGRFSGF